MGKIISVTNQKGGVGKTTTVINLGACLAAGCAGDPPYPDAHMHRSVLLIDADPQANTTSGLGFDKNKISKTLYEALMGDAPLQETIIKYEAIPTLDLVPSGMQLAGSSVEMVNIEEREFRLKKCLDSIKDKYEFILIDCPPSLGLLTVNALAASDTVLIPVQCEYYALEGLSQLMETIDLIKQSFNPNLDTEGFLLTMNSRTTLSNEVIEEVKKYFKEKVYNTVIPRNVKLSESPGYGKPAILYDITSRGAQSYMEFSKEFIEKQKLSY